MPRTRKQDDLQGLLGRYARWAPVEQRELADVELFLVVRRDWCGADPCTWREGDVEALLLDVFPRKVRADATLIQDGPGTLRRFLRWLEATGQLKGSGIYQNEAELADATPRFAAVMGAERGPSLFGELPLDLDDPQATVDAFNALSFEERRVITDHLVPDERVVLPPVSLAEEDELRPLAAAAPLAVRVGAMLRWVGPQGRAVTQTGALRLADAKALAKVCGDDDRLDHRQSWQPNVRRMADLPGVTEAFLLATGAGLLHVAGTRVRRDPLLPDDVLDRLGMLADVALARGVHLAEPPPYTDWFVDEITDVLPGVLGLLYAAAEPVPVDPLAEQLAEDLGVGPGGPQRDGTSAVRSYLELIFARLERLGMLTRLGLHVPEELRRLGIGGAQATSVAVTPLGLWWLQEALQGFGVRTPLTGDLAALTAAELCDRLPDYDEDSGQAEVDGWLAARTPADAGREVAELLTDPDVGRRQVAFSLLEDLPDATEAVRAQLDHPLARPYARVWLEKRGEAVPSRHRKPDDELLLFVETASLLLASGDDDELVGSLADLPDAPELVRRLWRVDSPYTEEVLEAIDAAAGPVLGKAARRALFSMRSAGRGR